MHHDEAPSAARTWLSTIPVLLVLLVSVAQGTSEIVQARMLAVGESTWPGYADLRRDLPPPTCDVDAIGANAAAAAPAGDGDLLDDLFGDDAPAADAPEDAPAGEGELLDDLFDDPPEDAAPAEAPAGEGDLLDDLFGDDDDSAGSANAAAIAAAKAQCQGEHDRYAQLQARVTPSLKAYRGVDGALTKVTEFGRRMARTSLILLFALCAATATALRAHISLRPVHSAMDARVSEGVQLLVNVLATASCVARYEIVSNAGVDQGDPRLALVWGGGFAIMALLNAWHLARPPGDLAEGGRLGHALLTVPLYAVMGVVASVWFLGFEDHPSGLAIYLDKLTEQSALYLQVGLFVWAGMLLKRTQLAHRSFDVLRPWELPPELLAIVVVIIAALPTAYSGASGIFVIAAGAIIYDELRRAGARNQLALAATAMSGSLGVVLSPCLLVVIVASLNKQVTTTQLFGAGYGVFALTAVLFIIGVLVTRQNPLHFAAPKVALPGSLTAAKSLLPYLLILVGTLGFYALVLDAWLDEHSAARILLVVLLLFLVWDGTHAEEGEPTTGPRLGLATTETAVHIGALLTLMGLSVGFGGVIERAEVMSMVPADLGSTWTTMLLLTAMLVVIGMLMDPYGAVILVSATIAHVAYDNGIEPLHFWMVVLVAFELGYLTPPVALNHLLTRLVVGDDADEDDLPPNATLWQRHERYLLPVSVMGTALVLVAFVPLAWG